MKKIISLILSIALIFAASVCTSAYYEEISSEDKNSALPNWQNVTGINVTFYVTNGRAYISYLITADTTDITVKIQVQKQTAGLFWFDVEDEKNYSSSEKKYLTGEYSVPVDGSGEYRVKLTVNAQNEKKTKTAEFTYDEKMFMGDANSDGKIQASDARLILRSAVQLEIFTQEQKSKCDMNLDGNVTTADARTVLRISAQLI